MLAAASTHLSSHGQPDTLTAHLEYPSRTSPGFAIIQIDDVKLSERLSTLHLTLWQGGLIQQAPWVTPGLSRRIVLAYATCTNLGSFAGITLPTGFETTAAAELPPLPEFKALKLDSQGLDGMWGLHEMPKAARNAARSLQKWSFYLPRHGPLSPGVLDMWTCLASGERITQCALPFVVDSFPVRICGAKSWYPKSRHRKLHSVSFINTRSLASLAAPCRMRHRAKHAHSLFNQIVHYS